MSAYIVNVDHIDYLLTGARQLGNRSHSWLRWGNEQITPFADFDAIGAELIAENAASVGYRYEETDLHNMPGPIDKERHMMYEYKPVHMDLPLADLAKAVHCYAYQACEHPGWETSRAKALCDSMEAAILRCLPGYDDADTWDWTRPAKPTQPEVIDLSSLMRRR